jgi:Ca2+-binding RTX toxin-like protein
MSGSAWNPWSVVPQWWNATSSGGGVGTFVGGQLAGPEGAMIGGGIGSLWGSAFGVGEALGDLYQHRSEIFPNPPPEPNPGPNGPYGPLPPYNPDDPADPYDPNYPYGPNGPYVPGGGATQQAQGAMQQGGSKKDPLVLDLAGVGLNLTSLAADSTSFDYAGDGFANLTAWVGSGTGILVVDPSGGAITNASQLVTSFSQLAAYDSNGDGIINISDSIYNSLMVWVGSGAIGLATGTGILVSLADLGIVSINLGITASNQIINGNAVTATSTFTLSDGSTREIASVDFLDSNSATIPDETLDLSPEIAALPFMAGSGTLYDLQSAAAGDPVLVQMLSTFAESPGTDPTTIENQVQAILYQWAGVSEIGADSYGNDVNAQQLAFLNAYLGQQATFLENTVTDTTTTIPGLLGGADVGIAWNGIYDAALTRLVLQSSIGSTLMPDVTYDMQTDTVQFVQPLSDSIVSRLGQPSSSNWAEWDLTLRSWDAARLDAGMNQLAYLYMVAATTSNELASLANAVAYGVNISFNSNGGIIETGTPLDDVLMAGQGVSELIGGGGGSNYLQTQASGDAFIYGASDGAVEISEQEIHGGVADNALLIDSSIDASTVTVRVGVGGQNIVISDGIAGDQITLDNMASTNNGGIVSTPLPDNTSVWGVQYVQFAEGPTWSAEQLFQMATMGTTGNDVLYGASVGSVFDGKGGNDVEIGISGVDTFVFNQGYGQLEVNEFNYWSQNSVLQLGAGINESSVTVSSNSSGNLTLTDGTTGDSIQLDGMRLNTQTDGIAQIEFADGTTWSRQQILNMATTGTTEADTLYGATLGSVFDGKGGGDVEIGISGADTFIYNQGYGQLEINEFDPWGQSSVLQLGAGLSESSVTVSGNSAGNIILTDGTTGDRIQLDGMIGYWGGLNSALGVTEVEFADGSVLTAQQLVTMAHTVTGTTSADTLSGPAGADLFDGKGGNDVEIGISGADTFIFNQGYGQLEINEFNFGNNSVLQLGAGISESSIAVSGNSAGDIILTDGTTGDRIQLDGMIGYTGSLDGYEGVAEVEFADGSVLTAQQLDTMAHTVTGTTGADTLSGPAGDDLFDGKGGNDVEIGISGVDTFVFNQGYGQLEVNEFNYWSQNSVLQLGAGINESSVTVSSNSSGNLTLTDGTTGDSIQLDGMRLNTQTDGIAQIEFADGTTWSRQQILNMATTGTTEADTLYGATLGSVFDGKGGGDVEIGISGADTFIYNQGYGQLEINEFDPWGQSSVLQLGAGLSESSVTVSGNSAGNIILTDGTTGDRIQLDGMIGYWGGLNSALGVTEVEFADGSVLTAQQLVTMAHTVTGTTSADTLSGPAGADLFDGKGGNDVEIGISGADTFIFNQGYGQLEINEFDPWGQSSILQLGAGLTESSLTVIGNSADDIILTDGTTGDRIQLDNMIEYWGGLNGGEGVAEVEFADGSVLTAQQLVTMAHTVTGTAGADTLSGPAGADLFDGKGGNDVEIGSSGADTFIFNQGYGQLEISELNYGNNSVLQLGSGISESSLVVSGNAAGDIILSDGIAGDSILIDNMIGYNGILNAYQGVAEVEFADGSVLTAQQLDTMAHAVTGTTGADILSGPAGADTFDGKGGSDLEIGSSGADTFIFNAGYGQLEISEYDMWGQSSVLKLGAGITESSLSVMRVANGSSLILSDGVAGDQITVDNMVTGYNTGVAKVDFADGSTLSASQLLAMATPIAGTSGADTLTGTALGDVFDGEGGTTDTEIGGGGNDTYLLQPGYGALTVQNGVATSNTANGTLSILNESLDDIWLKQVGNDLQVDIMGTTTEATIQGWFSNSYSQLSAIKVTDSAGATSVLDSQLSQLVQAMATYSAQNLGFDPTSATNPAITDPTLLALANSSYHH